MNLNPRPYPGDWNFNGAETGDAYLARTNPLLNAIPKRIAFPVADGYAHCAVLGDTRELQWSPFCAAYKNIRGS
jgi:hypothetical protein